MVSNPPFFPDVPQPYPHMSIIRDATNIDKPDTEVAAVDHYPKAEEHPVE